MQRVGCSRELSKLLSYLMSSNVNAPHRALTPHNTGTPYVISVLRMLFADYKSGSVRVISLRLYALKLSSAKA